jgi:hypothetical protein
MDHSKQMYSFLCAQWQAMEHYLVSMEPSPTATLKAYKKKFRFANLLALISCSNTITHKGYHITQYIDNQLPTNTKNDWACIWKNKCTDFKKIKMK